MKINYIYIFQSTCLASINSFGMLHFGITLRIHSSAKSVSSFSFSPIYFIENKAYVQTVFCCYSLPDFAEIYSD